MPPTHVTEAGVLSLISQSGPIAKLVLLTLLSASVFCWAIIFTKWKTFRNALRENKHFSEVFWSGKSVEELMGKSDKFPHSPVAVIFRTGIAEIRKISSHDPGTLSASEKIEQIYRSLFRASAAELGNLEKHLSWLATTASAAPFVGLFGTVWGIMNSFRSIGATGNANLAVVAPGISEALVTTAAGIAAAIPAVIAYNFFATQVKKVSTDLETFSHDFVSVFQKSNRKGSA